MSNSDVPLPTKGGSGGYIAAAAVMLLLMGGLIFWKLNDDSSETIVQTSALPSPKQEEPPVLNDPPPPPPPEEEEKAEPEPAPEEKKPKTATGNSGCGGPCNGSLSAAGMSALSAKGGQARGCYNRALRQDATLSGKMTLAVRISPTGSVCSASVAQDTLGDPAVATCVTQMFRAGKFPEPQGGCVDAQVPLNFVSQQ